MAPALTKFLKDGHGIHLSSPPVSGEQTLFTMDVDSQLEPSEDLQKMLFNLSALPSLDSYLQPNPLECPANTGVPTGHCGTPVFPSPDCLAPSYNRSFRESHQAASVLPGVPDMFLVPLPEHNSQEGCLLHTHRSASECRPGAGDVHSSYSLPTFSPPFANGDHNSFFAPTSVSYQKGSRLDQLVPRVELRETVKERVSRQTGLLSRAQKLQKRLQALLGQQALLHCDQQLQGLRTQSYHRGFSLDSISAGTGLLQVASEHNFPWPETSAHFTEIKEFSQSTHAVLRGLQEALDSEATASSSSSEDELDDNKMPREYRELCVGSPHCERRWLEERAELGSRWGWLQLRVAELDGRIQQLGELHKNIRSTKGCVVLAQSQPMTDRQIQHALLREAAGLSCTALDADNEPCSPTRLLHNIERQSAQLSQIVNSLMPPLNLSPLSKPWKDKRAFNSQVFVSGNSKRRKFSVRRRQLFKDDMSCVCARTRPLVTYHKPKLFTLNSTCNTSSSKCSGKSTFTLSGLSSSSCSYCSSCDPVDSYSDSRSSSTLSSRTTSGDSSLCSHFTKTSAREEWSQTPLVINALPLNPAHYRRHSSTPLYNSHKYKQYTRHHKKRVLGLSPIRHPGSFQKHHKRVNQRKRKRQRRHQFIEGVNFKPQNCNYNIIYKYNDLYLDDDEDLSLWEDSSDEILEESFTLVSQKQGSRGAMRRRQGESMFNIDNIIIPASLTKVEKLQYKDILTPSWQEVAVQSFLKNEADSEKDKDEQMEVLTDEVFAQRHLPLEQKEKMRWSFWGKKHCRHSLRSGSRLSSCGSGLCTSGEDNSVEWSFTQLDTDEQLSSEECLPQAPWERRVFPLNDDEEQALLSEVLLECPDSTCTFSTSKSLNFDLMASQATDTTPPSGGQHMNCTNSGS